MNVYIEETEEKIMAKDAKPFATLNGLPENNVFTINMAPMLARYVRFEIVEGNPDLIAYDDLCIAFTEISVMGTAVKGMQTSSKSDTLLSYSDPASHISWDVVRIDTNDIFTAVASSSLKKSKATNWQKSTLNMSPFYKIVGDDVYEVQFFDITGELVTDLSGRKVRIKIPITAAMSGNLSLIGNATDRTQIILYETTEDHDSNNVPYVMTYLSQYDGFKFVLTTISDESDPYWSTIGPLENFNDPIPSDPGSDPTNPGTGSQLPWALIMVSIITVSFVFASKNSKTQRVLSHTKKEPK